MDLPHNWQKIFEFHLKDMVPSTISVFRIFLSVKKVSTQHFEFVCLLRFLRYLHFVCEGLRY